MDDFRVDSVSPYGPLPDQRQSDPGGRRKRDHPARPAAEEDEIVLSLQGLDAPEEPLADVYTPGSRDNDGA